MIFLAYFPDLVDHFFNYTPLAISLKDDSRCGASVHRTIKPPLFKRHKFTLHGSYCLWTFHLRAYKKTWLDLISLLPKLLYIIATFFCFSEWSRAHFVHGVRVYLGTDSGIFPAALQYPSLDCISVRRSFQNPQGHDFRNWRQFIMAYLKLITNHTRCFLSLSQIILIRVLLDRPKGKSSQHLA